MMFLAPASGQFSPHGFAPAFPLPKGAPVERGNVHPRILERIVCRLIRQDPLNMNLKTGWISLQFALSDMDTRAGYPQRARARLTNASRAVNELLILDPRDLVWLSQRDYLDKKLLQFEPVFA